MAGAERDRAAREQEARDRAARRAARQGEASGEGTRTGSGAGTGARGAGSAGTAGGPPKPRKGLAIFVGGILVVCLALLAATAVFKGDEPQAADKDVKVSGGTRPAAAKIDADGKPLTASTPTATTSVTDARKPTSWPLVGASARARKVPILMYHLIAAAPAGTAYPGLWVPPEELKAQVTALDDAGFVGVTLGEVWAAWHGTGRLPAHPVVLSFDDGDLSQVLGAGPVLKDAGWPGVLNLAVSHLGKGGIPMWGAKRLINQGWEIDSHTIDHLDVTTLDPAELKHQLVGSRVAIKNRLGVNARFFCYPAGRNDATSQAAVKDAGFLAATTVDPGIASRADDPFTLPRIRVNPGTSSTSLVGQAKGTSAPPAGGAE